MPRIELISPVAICRWPHLNEPDFQWKEEGEFNVNLIISKDWKEGAAYVNQINEMCNEWQDKCTADAGGELNSFTSPVRTDKEDDTNWEVVFKMTSSGTEKSTGRQWDQRPTLINAKSPDKEFNDIIGSGSHLRIGGQPYLWFNKSKGKRAGIKLQPRIVTVYRCVSPEMKASALESMGLTEQETSYVVDGVKYDLTEDDKNDHVSDQEF